MVSLAKILTKVENDFEIKEPLWTLYTCYVHIHNTQWQQIHPYTDNCRHHAYAV